MTPEFDSEGLAERVGHPQDRWESLKRRIQDEALRRFAEVEEDWVALMWSLDAFRIYGVLPSAVRDIEALNRTKGTWFAELIALLLQNSTSQALAPRNRVFGYSQEHQIDVAWPRGAETDPRVCIETKVMGAPPSPSRPARPARNDWSNRRKEVKFAATDLKLGRREQRDAIEHWDAWRRRAWPRTYFLLAARLEPGADTVDRLVGEARRLTDHYLDGAGVVAWAPSSEKGYRIVPIPERTFRLDDVLWEAASQINHLVRDTR